MSRLREEEKATWIHSLEVIGPGLVKKDKRTVKIESVAAQPAADRQLNWE
jgi:hypothetical protein